jgi:DNA-directed RNA polymerase subunit M/transcription elongation factor TFIIS
MLPRQVKETCVAHMCPNCGTEHHITVEQVLSGDKTVTLCHCRACGHSWHPVVSDT